MILFLALPVFVGLLIAAAYFASRPETKIVGRVLFAILVAPVLMVPLYVVASNGDISHSMPMIGISLFAVILLLVVAIVAAIAANPNARPVALGVIGCIFVGLIGWFIIGTTSVKMAPATVATPEPMGAPMESPLEAPMNRRGQATAPAIDPATARAESGMIPVEAETAIPPTTPPTAAPPSATPAQPTPNANGLNGSFRRSTDAPMTIGTKENLPDWAKTGGGLRNDGTYYSVVVSGPFQSFDLCWQDLSMKLDQSIRSYLEIQPLAAPGRVPRVGISEELRKMAVTQHYLVSSDFSVGQMQTLYTRLEFTPQFRDTAIAWQRDLLADSRMTFTAIGGAILIALLGIVYGYFRIDTATRGFYTWRLRGIAGVLVVALGILAVATGAMFIDQESRLGGYPF